MAANSVENHTENVTIEPLLAKRMRKDPDATTRKSVVVLMRGNVGVRGGMVFMPNTIEMAILKKPDKGQFKTNIHFSSNMTETDVKSLLMENFPILRDRRFYCASVVDFRTRLEFHGERRIWDGRFIKKVIKGNSALYVFVEEDGNFGESEVVEDSGYESSIREQLGTKRSFDQITTCGELTSSESLVKMSLSSIDGPAQPGPEKLPVVISTHDDPLENISSHSNLVSGLAEKSAEKSDVELSNERPLMNVQQELVAPSNTILFLHNPLQQSLPMGGIPFIVFPTAGGIPVAPAPTAGNNALNTVPAQQSLEMPILPTSNNPGLQTALQASTLTPQLQSLHSSSASSQQPQNIVTSEASLLGSFEALTTVDTTEISQQLSLTGAEGDRTDVEGGQQETENFKSPDQEEPNVEKTDSSQVPEKESAESIAVAGDQESSGLSTLQISDLEPLLSEDSGFGTSEKSEENTSQDIHITPVGAATRGDTYAKNVMLLKNEDLAQRDGKILMPTAIEMARMRKTGQYKKRVQFSKSMSEDAVRKTIQETFPAFDLSGRFYCASISNTDSTFQFHGDPRIWDGKTIRRILKGNSALYIVMEEIQNGLDMHIEIASAQEQKEGEKDSGFLSNWVPIEERMDVEMASETYPEQGLSESETSGMLVSDPELKQEDQSLLQSSEDRDYEVVIKPDTSRLEGGDPFRVSFHPCLDANVTSVHAVFVKSKVIFGNVELAITPLALFGLRIPGAPSSGWANVILEDQNNTRLGFTEIFYFPDEEEADFMIQNPDQFKNFSEEVAHHNPSSFDSSDGDPQRYGAFGNAQQVQLLRLLIYTAARKGAQQFIEMILSTSAGRLVFNAYKDSQPLPEVVARDHGHNETACYLEGVTRRFSVEISASKEYPKKINWSELAQAAAEEAQKCNAENKGCHLISDLSKDAGYLGDVETSSSEPNSSGSEDDISIASKRECNTENESDDLTSDLSKDAGYLGNLETSKEPQSSDSEDDISIMSNRVNGDENLARAMNLEVIDVHDVQSLQDTEVAEKAEVMFPKIWEAVQCHPTGVDKLDDVKMEGKISDICTKDLDSTQEEICTNSDIDVDQRGVIEDISPSLGSVKKGKEHADWDRISPQTIKLTTPGASLSGWGDVIFKAHHCYCLGSTKLFYYPDEREFVIMVKNPNLFETLCKDMSCHTANSSYNCSDEGTQRSESFAGRLVFDAYKNSQPLPEVVAKDHGQNKTACYLEGVTKRFSEETFAVEEYPKAIDWSELAKAAEEAQRKHECDTENESSDLTSYLSKDAGYLGDLETSSNEPQSSDSEDSISITSNKVYGDKNLARAMDFEVVDLHDVQSLQDTEDAEKFREKAEVMFPKIQEVVPTPADELDDVRVEGKISGISAKDLDAAQEEIGTNLDNSEDQPGVVQDISPSSGSVKISGISSEDLGSAPEEICTSSDNDADQPGVVQDISPSSGSVKKSKEHVDWDGNSPQTIKLSTPGTLTKDVESTEKESPSLTASVEPSSEETTQSDQEEDEKKTIIRFPRFHMFNCLSFLFFIGMVMELLLICLKVCAYFCHALIGELIYFAEFLRTISSGFLFFIGMVIELLLICLKVCAYFCHALRGALIYFAEFLRTISSGFLSLIRMVLVLLLKCLKACAYFYYAHRGELIYFAKFLGTISSGFLSLIRMVLVLLLECLKVCANFCHAHRGELIYFAKFLGTISSDFLFFIWKVMELLWKYLMVCAYFCLAQKGRLIYLAESVWSNLPSRRVRGIQSWGIFLMCALILLTLSAGLMFKADLIGTCFKVFKTYSANFVGYILSGCLFFVWLVKHHVIFLWGSLFPPNPLERNQQNLAGLSILPGNDLSVGALSDNSVEAGLSRATTNSILERYSPNEYTFLHTSPLKSAEDFRRRQLEKYSFLHTSP